MQLNFSNEGIKFGIKQGDVDLGVGLSFKDGVPALGANVGVAGTEIGGKIDIAGRAEVGGKTNIGDKEYKASVGFSGNKGPEVNFCADDKDGSGGFAVKASKEGVGMAVKKKHNGHEFAYAAEGNANGDMAIGTSYKSSDGRKSYSAGFKNNHREGFSADVCGRHRHGKHEYGGRYRTDSEGNHELDGAYRSSDGDKKVEFQARRGQDGHCSGRVSAHHRNHDGEIRTEFDADSKGSGGFKGSYERAGATEKYEIEGHRRGGRYSGKATGYRKGSHVSFERNEEGTIRGSYNTSGGSRSSWGRRSRHGHHTSIEDEESVQDGGQSYDRNRDGRTGSSCHETPPRYDKDGSGDSSDDGLSNSDNYSGDRRRPTTDDGSHHHSHSSHHRSRGSHHGSSGSNHHLRGSHNQSRGSNYQSRGSHHRSRGFNHHSRGSDHHSGGSNYNSRGSHTNSRGSYYNSRGSNYKSRGSYHQSRGSHYSDRSLCSDSD